MKRLMRPYHGKLLDQQEVGNIYVVARGLKVARDMEAVAAASSSVKLAARSAMIRFASYVNHWWWFLVDRNEENEATVVSRRTQLEGALDFFDEEHIKQRAEGNRCGAEQSNAFNDPRDVENGEDLPRVSPARLSG